MPHFSNTTAIILVGACVFLVIVKTLKAERIAAGLCFAAIILWLVLHFTGYDKTLYQIIFQAPPIQHAQPEDLKYR